MSQNFGTQMGRQAKWTLLLLGIVFLVIGGGVYFGLGSDSLVGSALMPMAIIFVVTGAIMIVVSFIVGRSTAASQAVAEHGQLGSARIMGLTQTGMTLNDQPQIGMDLEVTVPGLSTYRVTHKEFVPFLFLSRLQPGGVLAVRVDPAKPQKVVVAWNEAPPAGGSFGAGASNGFGGVSAGSLPGATMVGGIPAAGGAPVVPGAGAESLAQVAAAMQQSGAHIAPVFSASEQANYSVDQLRQWLRENGLPGTARIDRLEDSGQTVGNDRLMTMQTTTEVPGQPPHQGPASAAMVPLAKVGRLAVGVTLPVLVAPGNPDLEMFEWDKI
jgi:hypothetical protein